MRDDSFLFQFWSALATNHRYAKYITPGDLKIVGGLYMREGSSAFTKTLPLLGKWLESQTSMQPLGKPCGLPLLAVAERLGLAGDPAAIECYRQLTLAFYKLEVPYDQGTISAFLANFKRIDQSVPDEETLIQADEDLISRVTKLIGRVLCNLDPYDIVPRHGSGATSCRAKPWDKWHQFRYFPKLDAVFPYSDHFFFSSTHLADELGRLSEAEEGVPTARVILVPKDSRGPRVISAEPAEYMYIQQGLRRLLYRGLESHTLTSGFINFSDQSVNQRLAALAHMHGLATLDMKDASDRVGRALVSLVFPHNWVRALEACRSTHTLLPDGDVLQLKKFAPMGSACCFPVEALLFWAISSAAITRDFGLKRPEVFVYGDDIVVKASHAATAIKALETVGLLINRTKSFVGGPFYESCGKEFYRGLDVTPVRVRHTPNARVVSRNTDADLCNLLIAKFGISDAYRAVQLVEQRYRVPFPRTDVPSPGCLNLNPSASNDVFFRKRFNKSLQRIEHRIPTLAYPASRRREPAWCELMKIQLSKGDGYGLTPAEAKALDPGCYTDDHQIVKSWSWAWLG